MYYIRILIQLLYIYIHGNIRKLFRISQTDILWSSELGHQDVQVKTCLFRVLFRSFKMA